MLILLNKLWKHYQIPNSLLDWFSKYIGEEFNGKSLDMDYQDESGALTLNVAQTYLQDGQLTIGMNLRIPVNTPIETIKNRFKELLQNTNIFFSFSSEKEALYIPKNHPLVNILCDIFNKKSGLKEEPIAIRWCNLRESISKPYFFWSKYARKSRYVPSGG